MKQRFSEAQIIGILKPQESGVKTSDVCRAHNISQNTFYTCYTWNAPKGHPIWRYECVGSATAAPVGSGERQTEAHRSRPSLGPCGFEGRALKKLVQPAVKRQAVPHVQAQHGLSQRRACRRLNCNRSSARHVAKRPDDAGLRAALQELAAHKPAWGYRMLHAALRLDGWHCNHKKTHRLYREAGLALKRQRKKRLKCETRRAVAAATAPGQRWTMDFIHDTLADGRSFRTLNLSDTFTRQCLGQAVDTSLTGQRVVRLLETVRQAHGLPQLSQVDNGPEFRSQALDLWAYQNKVKLDFIEPGKPTQNGHIESFNGRFRAECLDQEWFGSLAEARAIIAAWRSSYNSQRPHSSLDYLPPDVWTEKYQHQQQNLRL